MVIYKKIRILKTYNSLATRLYPTEYANEGEPHIKKYNSQKVFKILLWPNLCLNHPA